MSAKSSEGEKCVVRIDRWIIEMQISSMIDEGNPNNLELEFEAPRWLEVADDDVGTDEE
jgi:hypothetical protein